MNSESLLNAIFSKDENGAMDALNGALAAKIGDALEVKKIEIASNFISTPAAETVSEPVEVEDSAE
jgi:hypothetical protein